MFELEVRNENYLTTRLDQHTQRYIYRAVEKFLVENESNDDAWSLYKLARMCVRYTFYDLADRIYAKLALKITNSMFNMSTSDLSFKCWVDFMSFVCKAEDKKCSSKRESDQQSSINEFVRDLNESLSYYMRAITLFKSTCTRSLAQTQLSSSNIFNLENVNTCFQIRYCELRSEQLKLYIHLMLAAMTFSSIPAPVFHFNTTESFNKFGRIAQQLKYAVNELQKLNQKYKDFLSECFDADQHTINILNT